MFPVPLHIPDTSQNAPQQLPSQFISVPGHAIINVSGQALYNGAGPGSGSEHQQPHHENDQLNHWLQKLSPGEQRALYEASLSRGSRIDQNLILQPPAQAKRNLDKPQGARPKPKEKEELTITMECKICMDQLIDTVLLPCGHATLCRWCADEHIPSYKGYPVKGNAKCPMCRAPVKSKNQIFFL